MLDVEQAERLGAAAGPEAGAIVGLDPMDLDPVASKEAQGVQKEAQA
jgi:hypothetical protein